jgi:hypothetical protein
MESRCDCPTMRPRKSPAELVGCNIKLSHFSPQVHMGQDRRYKKHLGKVWWRLPLSELTKLSAPAKVTNKFLLFLRLWFSIVMPPTHTSACDHQKEIPCLCVENISTVHVSNTFKFTGRSKARSVFGHLIELNRWELRAQEEEELMSDTWVLTCVSWVSDRLSDTDTFPRYFLDYKMALSVNSLVFSNQTKEPTNAHMLKNVKNKSFKEDFLSSSGELWVCRVCLWSWGKRRKSLLYPCQEVLDFFLVSHKRLHSIGMYWKFEGISDSNNCDPDIEKQFKAWGYQFLICLIHFTVAFCKIEKYTPEFVWLIQEYRTN